MKNDKDKCQDKTQWTILCIFVYTCCIIQNNINASKNKKGNKNKAGISTIVFIFFFLLYFISFYMYLKFYCLLFDCLSQNLCICKYLKLAYVKNNVYVKMNEEAQII